jgi:hypothetical protein
VCVRVCVCGLRVSSERPHACCCQSLVAPVDHRRVS